MIIPRTVVAWRKSMATIHMSNQATPFLHDAWNLSFSRKRNRSFIGRKVWICSTRKICPFTSGRNKMPKLDSQRLTTETRWIVVQTQNLSWSWMDNQQGAYRGLSPMVMVPGGACISALSSSTRRPKTGTLTGQRCREGEPQKWTVVEFGFVT